MKELLFMKPVFKDVIWGGNRMREIYGYDIPSETTGECWAISAHPNGACVIANGTYEGMSLPQLWDTHKELFGNEDGRLGAQFPLLIKIIDARENLSIQVHPDDSYAAMNENGSLGKMECWYILDAEEGTDIVIGHHAADKAQMVEMVEGKDWKSFIREVPVKAGDFYQINPGCLHAIKGGTLILETQQSSDITYRVYDYDRLTDGQPRQLHLQQSLDVIEAPFIEETDERTKTIEVGVVKEHMVTCPNYTVEKFDISGEWSTTFEKPFVNVSILEGTGTWNGTVIKKGQHFIVPAGYGTCNLAGAFSMICSWIEE